MGLLLSLILIFGRTLGVALALGRAVGVEFEPPLGVTIAGLDDLCFGVELEWELSEILEL